MLASARRMKLIIQIPCFNEAASLPVTLAELPRQLDGFGAVEWLVIDDGSTDGTADVARANGVQHVVRFTKNQGLARAFTAGIEAALAAGADVIVNTDADNQYQAADIGKLVAPILERRADMVIGARPIDSIEHFSPVKKLLQRLGSWVVQFVSRTRVADAPSGFRALSRSAALGVNVFSGYTYTLETIIQAGQRNLEVVSVPIRVNGDMRPSRLVKSIRSYVQRSIFTIFRIFIVYKPFVFFGVIGLVLFGLGMLLNVRFLALWLAGQGGGHVQSLILGAVLSMMGFQTVAMAFLADLISVNRRLLEELQRHQRSVRLAGTTPSSEEPVSSSR